MKLKANMKLKKIHSTTINKIESVNILHLKKNKEFINNVVYFDINRKQTNKKTISFKYEMIKYIAKNLGLSAEIIILELGIV